MKDKLEEIGFWIVGTPIILLFSLLYFVCRLCGIHLEDDF